MANTLILYDGKLSSTERVANSLGMIIGNVCIAEISEAPEDISPYDGFCFIFNFYGALTAGKTRQYLTAHREAMVGRRIALVGMGFSDNGFTKYVVDMEDAVGEGISITGMFINDENQVFESGFQIARMFRAPWNEMDPDELTSIIDEYIKAHTTLALATAGKGDVRCTPLEYIYKDGVFYIVTEGGLKFRSLLSNDDISAAIFEPYDGSMDHISGLQFSGKAAIVERGCDEYWEVLRQKNVSKEACENLPVELFIVRIVPLRYEFLCSKFNEDGYDAKQFVNTRFAKQRWEDGVAFAKEKVDHEAVARREMAEKAAAAEKAIEENKRSISFTEIQEVRKPYDSSDIEALLREAEESSDEVPDEPAESTAGIDDEAGADYDTVNIEDDEPDDSDEIADDFDDDLEDDVNDDFEDDEDDDFEYDFDDDFEEDEDEFEDDYDESDDDLLGFEDEYEEEPVREITKASGEIDIEELRRLMEEDENNESSGDYTFADDDEYDDAEPVDDEYEDDEYDDDLGDDEYEDDELTDDEYEDDEQRSGGEKKGGFSLKNFLASAFGRRKSVEDEYEEDEYEDDEYEDDDLDEYEDDEYEDEESEEYEDDEYEDDEYEEDEYEDAEYEDEESDEYEDAEYEDEESDEYEDDEYEDDESDEYEDNASDEYDNPELEDENAEPAENEPENPEGPEVSEEDEKAVDVTTESDSEDEASEEAADETEPEIAAEDAAAAEPEIAAEDAVVTEAETEKEISQEAAEAGPDGEEDEDQPEAVLAYNVQDAIEKIRRNMAGVKAEQSETYLMPELEKTDTDMTEAVQADELTLDEDEIAEKYGSGPDIEGDFDALDEDNTYDLFETETDEADTADEDGSEETRADWEDAEKRVSSFRQIFSYRNETETDGAEDTHEGTSLTYADEDEEFEKLFGFRNTSIYEDDETEIDRGRSYGRTRFDDDDDFEYDDEYSYDDDDDVLTDDELDELADDEEDVPERGKKKGGIFSRNPFAGLAGLFGGKKKFDKEDYEDDVDAEYEDDEYEDDEDSEYEDYEDEEDELPDFDDSVKSPAGLADVDGMAKEQDKEGTAGGEAPHSEYEVDDGDFTELKIIDEDEDDALSEVKDSPDGGEGFSEADEYEDEDDFSEADDEDEDDFSEADEYEDEDDFTEADEYEDEDDFLEADEYEDEDISAEVREKGAAREPKRGGFFSGLGKSISSLIGSSKRKADDDDDYIDDFDDEDDEEEMRGDVIDRLERNFEKSVGRSGKYVVPAFDDSLDDLDSPDEDEEEEDDLLPYEDYDIPEISYTDDEAGTKTDTQQDEENVDGLRDDEYEDAEYEDAEYEDDFEDDEYEDENDEGDIYDELEEDDSLSAPGIRRRSKGNESAGKSSGFISRLKAAFGGMKKKSAKEDDGYEDDEYEDDEYEEDEYEDDEYEEDEYEEDEYEDDEYEDDEYEEDEYEDDEYEEDEYEDDEYEDDEPAPAKKPFGKIFMRKKPEKKVRGWNSEPVGKWNDEEEGVFDLDRNIDAVDISSLSDRLVAALDDDMVEEFHPDLDE